MAHAGKNYPLAFRRDLATNLTNNKNSWAKAYWPKFSQCLGSLPPFFVHLTVVCVEVPPAATFSKWESDWTNVNGRTVKVEFEVNNTSWDNFRIGADWQLIDQVKGQLAFGRISANGPNSYGGVQGTVKNGTGADPSLFQTLGNNSQLIMSALSWPEWNNL